MFVYDHIDQLWLWLYGRFDKHQLNPINRSPVLGFITPTSIKSLESTGSSYWHLKTCMYCSLCFHSKIIQNPTIWPRCLNQLPHVHVHWVHNRLQIQATQSTPMLEMPFSTHVALEATLSVPAKPQWNKTQQRKAVGIWHDLVRRSESEQRCMQMSDWQQ